MINLKEFIEQNSINFFKFHFTDLFGKFCGIAYDINKINGSIFTDGITYYEKELQENIVIAPDINTIFSDPFCAQPTASVLCNVMTCGKREFYDSRSIAKKALDYISFTKTLEKIQFDFEIEFFIFDEIKLKIDPYISHVSFTPVDSSTNRYNNRKYCKNYPLSSLDLIHDIRSEMLSMLGEAGIKSPLCHQKITSSRHSIRVNSDNFFNTADYIQKSKYVIHNVAHSYGKSAIFMPKPLIEEEGCSLHLYCSLLQANNEMHYMGGIKKHIKAINAFSNPMTNSYKRLMELDDTSYDASADIKLSFPDPSANPYLFLAAQLMAGIDGIENKIDPKTVTEVKAATSLQEALESLNHDRKFLLKGEVFTDQCIDYYIKMKSEEIKKLNMTTHPVEFLNYYNNF
ncbi:glutamine synthetase family protein [Wolbachia endosymbiont of Pentidionis agamae]|uniref:hypothetical protein n=1 Tax=Wolbachia endosymbiont of Pentidionis agamae TaxID=3110435 RepID=UPI002FD44944